MSDGDGGNRTQQRRPPYPILSSFLLLCEQMFGKILLSEVLFLETGEHHSGIMAAIPRYLIGGVEYAKDRKNQK